MSRYCLTSFNISIKIAVFGICFHFALYSHIFFLYLLQIRIEINTRRIAQWEIWSSFKTQFVTKINTCSLWYITACFPTSPAFIYNDIFVYASLRQKNKEILKSSHKNLSKSIQIYIFTHQVVARTITLRRNNSTSRWLKWYRECDALTSKLYFILLQVFARRQYRPSCN